MYYVLFTWVKGKKERDFQGFRTKPELIDFLGKNFEKIIVWNIHKAATEYRFGLVEKESKPEEEGGAFMQDLTPESDEEKPADYLGSVKIPEEAIMEPEEETEPRGGQAVNCKTTIITAQDLTDEEARKEKKEALDEIERQKKKHPYLRNKEKEKSAMEKIGEDIEEEQKENLTEEEIKKKNKEALKRAEKSIEAAKKEQEKKVKGWALCTECNFHHVAPWNKKGICSVCQRPKGTRKYTKRK